MYVCMYAEAKKPPKFWGGLKVVAMYCGVSILGIVPVTFKVTGKHSPRTQTYRHTYIVMYVHSQYTRQY